MGQWYLTTVQPGLVDLDGISDGVAVLSTSSFRFTGPGLSVPPPAAFAPTDIIAGATTDLHYFVGAPPLVPAGPGSIGTLKNIPVPQNESDGALPQVTRIDSFDAATFTYDGDGVVPGTVHFGGGARTAEFPLRIVHDDLWKGLLHPAVLQFHRPDGSNTGPPFVFTVFDIDGPPSIAFEPPSIKEGDEKNQRIDLTLVLTGRTTLPASITFGSGYFFTPLSTAPIVFAPGETRKTVSFTYNGDRYAQGNHNESFRVDSISECRLNQSFLSVIDDDIPPSVTISDVDGNEAAGSLRFQIRITPAPATDVQARIDTVSGSAVEGTDFVGIHRQFYFYPGQSLAYIDVPLIRDSIDEYPESFKVVLSAPLGVALSRATAIGTIAEMPSVQVSDTRVTEGSSGTREAKVRFSVFPISSAPVVVRYSTIEGTATAGVDYVDRSGSVTIPAGSSGVTETFLITGDELIEPDETFRIVLSSPTGAAISRGTATVTIVDDDSPTPVVSMDDAVAIETNSGVTAATFQLHLDRPSTDPVTITWAASDGSATSPDDYSIAGGSVTFAPGQVEATIVVMVNGDKIVEPDEDFFVTLTSPVNARLGNESAHAWILNDDGLRRGRVAGH